MSRIAIILSHRRSGSHLVGHALGLHPEVCYIDELTRHIRTKDLGRLETVHDVEDLVWGAAGDEPVTLVDIKYEMVCQQPMLEGFLRRWPVVHLFRTDLWAWWYSERHAMARKRRKSDEYALGVSRLDVTDPPEPVPVHLDLVRFIPAASRLIQRQKRFNRLAMYSLTYEELTGGREIEVVPEAIGRRLCAVLGVDCVPLHAQTRKMSPEDYDRYWR